MEQQISPNEDEDSSAGSSVVSLTPADLACSPKLRAVKLRRGPDGEQAAHFALVQICYVVVSGNFGITLSVSKGGNKHFVDGRGVLFPNDRLIEVNGENVEGASSERINQLFQVPIVTSVTFCPSSN